MGLTRFAPFIGKTVLKSPTCLPALMLQAHTLSVQGAWGSSLSKLLAAFRMAPDEPLVCLSTGVALLHHGMSRKVSDRLKALLAAVAFLQRYASLRGLNQEAAYNLGRAFHQLGLPNLAMTYYERALREAPEGGARARGLYCCGRSPRSAMPFCGGSPSRVLGLRGLLACVRARRGLGALRPSAGGCAQLGAAVCQLGGASAGAEGSAEVRGGVREEAKEEKLPQAADNRRQVQKAKESSRWQKCRWLPRRRQAASSQEARNRAYRSQQPAVAFLSSSREEAAWGTGGTQHQRRTKRKSSLITKKEMIARPPTSYSSSRTTIMKPQKKMMVMDGRGTKEGAGGGAAALLANNLLLLLVSDSYAFWTGRKVKPTSRDK